jgi:hypothetical protein
MANALFDPGREGFLNGTIDWDTDTIEYLLVRGYTFTASHKFETDMTGAGGTIVQRVTGAGQTATNGVADSTTDPVWATVTAGASIAAIVVLSNKGSAATNRLIAFIDTATGLPVTPNGGNITLVIDNGTNRLFKL